MNIREAFEVIECFDGIDKATVDSLMCCGILENVKKGEAIYCDKDIVCNLYFLVEGWVSISKFSSSGEKKVIFVFGKGKALNEELINGLPASSNCEAIENSKVLSIPMGAFILAMEDDYKLCMAVMNSMSVKIRRLYRQMKNSSNFLRGDKKIAAKLWKLSMDYGKPCKDGTEISMDFTITYFADLMGSTRESVSRQLKVLTDKGLVIYTKNRFVIPDREKLREFFNAP